MWAVLENRGPVSEPEIHSHSHQPECFQLPHLTTLHGTAQVPEQAVGHGHVVLTHGPILEAPAFAIVVDKLCSLAGKEQGFLIVL